jgi:hypothetical protein
VDKSEIKYNEIGAGEGEEICRRSCIVELPIEEA